MDGGDGTTRSPPGCTIGCCGYPYICDRRQSCEYRKHHSTDDDGVTIDLTGQTEAFSLATAAAGAAVGVLTYAGSAGADTVGWYRW